MGRWSNTKMTDFVKISLFFTFLSGIKNTRGHKPLVYETDIAKMIRNYKLNK